MGEFNENGISYDQNGNIKTLRRTDKGGAQIDDLLYDYGIWGGNKLISVTDAVTDVTNKKRGFNDGSTVASDYNYDANGNQIVDKNKSVTAPIDYNYLNLVQNVARGNNAVQYTYDAVGQKMRR